MTHISAILIATLAIAATPERAAAQTRTSDQIANEWRDAKRGELQKQRDILNTQIRLLKDNSTPEVDAPVQASVAVPLAIAPLGQQQVGQGVPLAAVAPPPVLPPIPPPVPPTAKAIAEELKTLGSKPGGTFGGIAFGGGISFTLDIGTSDRINDAALVNGIVRVNDEDNGRARVMLESHYFFTPDGSLKWLGLSNNKKESQWGWGPFIALHPGTDDVIEAVGMGIMFGARRGSGDESFNLGFGVVVDPNTRILGEGLKVNQPLPAGESAIRYKEEMQTGILILSSFSF